MTEHNRVPRVTHRRPTRPDPIMALRNGALDLNHLHADLPTGTTPQSVFDDIADAHAALVRAMGTLQYAAEAHTPRHAPKRAEA